MSDQPEYETQEPSTAQELRQSLLDAIDTQRQVVDDLSDEELEIVAGGILGFGPKYHDAHAEFTQHQPGIRERIANKWNKMPTAFKAEGIASAVVGPVTALSVGTISQVIANRS